MSSSLLMRRAEYSSVDSGGDHRSGAKKVQNLNNSSGSRILNVDVDSLSCSKCDDQFDGAILYHCYECPVKFESIRDLTAHMMMHAMLKPFCCGRCLQSFAGAEETVQHFNFRL